MQIDRSGTMAELIPAQRAIVALLMIQTRPLRCLRGGTVIVGAIQLDPVAELMLVVQDDAVIDCHLWSVQC